MINASDLLHIPFYEKSPFTGSCQGMRYYIEKASIEENNVLKVSVFPGPFCFAKTPDDQKTVQTFPFSEEGLALTAEWLNAQYEARPEYWQSHKALIP